MKRFIKPPVNMPSTRLRREHEETEWFIVIPGQDFSLKQRRALELALQRAGATVLGSGVDLETGEFDVSFESKSPHTDIVVQYAPHASIRQVTAHGDAPSHRRRKRSRATRQHEGTGVQVTNDTTFHGPTIKLRNLTTDTDPMNYHHIYALTDAETVTARSNTPSTGLIVGGVLGVALLAAGAYFAFPSKPAAPALPPGPPRAPGAPSAGAAPRTTPAPSPPPRAGNAAPRAPAPSGGASSAPAGGGTQSDWGPTTPGDTSGGSVGGAVTGGGGSTPLEAVQTASDQDPSFANAVGTVAAIVNPVDAVAQGISTVLGT